MSVSLVYETHSTTTDNEAGIATGWLPGELSPLGRQQAAQLGRRRRDDGVAVVYTSDLTRSIETGSIAFEGSDVPVQQDPRLRECNYGSLNGTSSTNLPRAAHVDVPFPEGESYQDVVGRTRSFLEDVVRQWARRQILVIGHSANRWALDVLLEDASLEEFVGAPFEWQPGWEYTVPDVVPGSSSWSEWW